MSKIWEKSNQLRYFSVLLLLFSLNLFSMNGWHEKKEGEVEYDLLQKNYISISELIFEGQAQVSGDGLQPRRKKIKALPQTYNIEALLQKHGQGGIAACPCLNHLERVDVARSILKIALHHYKPGQTLTILSLGSGRLKQEILTANELMLDGFNVEFILIDPLYYFDAAKFERQIDFPAILDSCQKILAEISQLTGKTCSITQVYPSLYMYLYHHGLRNGKAMDYFYGPGSPLEFDAANNIFTMAIDEDPKNITIDMIESELKLKEQGGICEGAYIIQARDLKKLAYARLQSEDPLSAVILSLKGDGFVRHLKWMKHNFLPQPSKLVDGYGSDRLSKIRDGIQALLAQEAHNRLKEIPLKAGAHIKLDEKPDIIMAVDVNNRIEDSIEHLTRTLSDPVYFKEPHKPFVVHVERTRRRR